MKGYIIKMIKTRKITALILTFLIAANLWGCAVDSSDKSSDSPENASVDTDSGSESTPSAEADPLSAAYDDPQFEYAAKLFGSGIISIQITADPAEWQNMLDNATAEEYIPCDVVVNGVEFKNVGIRPKGNSSLSQVASSDSDRYSFRLKFDKYDKEQSCFGLTTFVVNNMTGDSSYMKEYISYDIMTYAGVNSPFYEFADISVNGEAWGFYLAIELYDDEFLIRNYGNDKGELYNVKMAGMGNGNFIKNDGNSVTLPEGVEIPENLDGNGDISSFPMMTMPDGNPPAQEGEEGAPFEWNVNDPSLDAEEAEGLEKSENTVRDVFVRGGSGSGGSLEYTDDNPESYSSIFENNVSNIDDEDKEKVIEALKALSEGRDLEKYFDVDQILRYLAAHTVVVNLDSYSSNMAQNYYLFEKGGKLTVLPWDYNYAFGGFQSNDASSTVNFPIDTPVSGVTMESRPLISKLFENEEYLERYHKYLQEIVDGYLSNIDTLISQLNAKISSYVQNDPSKFCTYEEYEKAVEALNTLINLRAESIQGQLNGTVPSTTEGQKENPDALIDSSGVDMSALSNTGGRMRIANGDNEFSFNINGADGTALDEETMQKAMEIINGAGGNITDEIKQELYDLGLTDEIISMFANQGNRGNRGNFARPGN